MNTWVYSFKYIKIANGDYINAVRYLQYAADSETAYNAENPSGRILIEYIVNRRWYV